MDRLRVEFNGRTVGHLGYESDICYFAYDRDWLKDGFSISPRSLPLAGRTFQGRYDRFEGLFGVFSDSLPDGWGTFAAVKALRKKGMDYLALDPLTRLSMVDADGLGALNYVPSRAENGRADEKNIDELCVECMSMIENEETDYDDIFRRAGSTGGARPKVNMVIDGEGWVVKFRERRDPEWMGRMEYEYNMAAKECGIDVPEIRLIESDNCDGYFASKRFDRDGGHRIHMISLGGLLETPKDMPLLDYLTFLQATRFVTGSQNEVVKAFRLSCFNILAKNFDDHSKNFAFLYDEKERRYMLSPAFDITRTFGMREHEMSCMGNGLPGKGELFSLAKSMNIPRRKAEEIVTAVGDVVSERLSEWIDVDYP